MSNNTSSTTERGMWSEQEHDKFLVGLKMYPQGPWKAIAAHIGTRSSRQVQTHAQKYYEKVARRMRGLRKDRKKVVRSEHRLGDDMTTLCADVELEETGIRIGQIRRGLNAIAGTKSCSSSPADKPTAAEEEIWDPAPGTTTRQPDIPSAASLDWIDSLVEDDEEMMAMWSHSAQTNDSLVDVDDCYLNYLIEILESSEFTIAES